MNELKEIIGDYEPFLTEIIEEVEELGFDINDLAQIDHMCYRTTSQANYEEKKAELEAVANLLGETMVQGRLIATYRLIEPIYHDIWRIDLVELPAPKPSKPFTEGLEHIEFVIYDDFETFLSKYPSEHYQMQSAERGINPEVGLQLEHYGVKFHLLSLSTVLYLEHKLGIDTVSNEDS